MNRIHSIVVGFLCLIFVGLVACKNDDEPISLSMSISLDWNGPELANGETLMINGLEISDVMIDDEVVDNPSISTVQYFIGNKPIGESKTYPYRIQHLIEELPEGSHEFRVDVVFNDLPNLGKQRAWITYQLKIK